MKSLPEIEPKSTDSILNNLGLAIDETKLIKTIENSKEMLEQLRTTNPQSRRLIFLARQIPNLEAKLVKIRERVNGK